MLFHNQDAKYTRQGVPPHIDPNFFSPFDASNVVNNVNEESLNMNHNMTSPMLK